MSHVANNLGRLLVVVGQHDAEIAERVLLVVSQQLLALRNLLLNLGNSVLGAGFLVLKALQFGLGLAFLRKPWRVGELFGAFGLESLCLGKLFLELLISCGLQIKYFLCFAKQCGNLFLDKLVELTEE